MRDEIQRLGFDAWADNKMVNIIENAAKGTVGNLSIESEDYYVLSWWNEKTINCCIRAYTGKGWEVYEKEIKR
jgi:hypothetical protein